MSDLGKCSCKRGQQRDNCPECEGTGRRIDFRALRAKPMQEPQYKSQRIKIEFTTGSAAFDNTPATEIEACLKRVFAAINDWAEGGPVRDSNGNTVGTWSITEEGK